METSILKELNYDILVPTGYHFMTRYLNCIQASERTRHLAHYYAERNLQEFDMLNETPHKFVAAAIYASLKQQSLQYPKLAHIPVWNPRLQEESGYQESDLIACARNMIVHCSEEPETASKRRLVAAKKKFAHEKYGNVSTLALPTF